MSTRVRWGILSLLFFVSAATYLDRLNISVAGKPMSESLGLTDLEFGAIFSAFVLGAIMNTGTNLVGAAAPILTPVIKDQYGWPAAWTMAGLLSFAAGLLWLRVGSRSPRLTESQTDAV